jgi:hypothetical protein
MTAQTPKQTTTQHAFTEIYVRPVKIGRKVDRFEVVMQRVTVEIIGGQPMEFRALGDAHVADTVNVLSTGSVATARNLANVICAELTQAVRK